MDLLLPQDDGGEPAIPANVLVYAAGDELELVDLLYPTKSRANARNNEALSDSSSSSSDDDIDPPGYELPTTVLRDISSGRLVMPWLVGNAGLRVFVAMSPPPAEEDWQYHTPEHPARLVNSLWGGYRMTQTGLDDRYWQATATVASPTASTAALATELAVIKAAQDCPAPYNFITKIERGDDRFEANSECNYERQRLRQMAVEQRLDQEEQRAIKANEPIPPRPPPPPLPKVWQVLVFSLHNLHAALWVAQRVAFQSPARLMLKKYETRLLIPNGSDYVSIPAQPTPTGMQLAKAVVWDQLPVWKPGIQYQLQQDVLAHYGAFDEDDNYVHVVSPHVGGIGTQPIVALPLQSPNPDELPPPPAPDVVKNPAEPVVPTSDTVLALPEPTTLEPIDRMMDAEEQVERGDELLNQVLLAPPEAAPTKPLSEMTEHPAEAEAQPRLGMTPKAKKAKKISDRNLGKQHMTIPISQYLAQAERPYRIPYEHDADERYYSTPVYLWLLIKIEQGLAKGDATKRTQSKASRKRAGAVDAKADANIPTLTALWSRMKSHGDSQTEPVIKKRKFVAAPIAVAAEPQAKKRRVWTDYFIAPPQKK